MHRLSRLLPSLTLSLLALGAVPAAQAEAPQVRTQVPGYQRHLVGQFEVTALYDGRIQLDSKLLKNATPKEISQLLARAFRNSPMSTAVTAYLVNTGKQLVLVDAGAAQLFGPGLGQVLSNLKAAGYQPEQVDAVLLTHLHGDHVGGLRTADGQMAFPNAQVYVSKVDADHWLNPAVMAKAPAAAQGFFQAAQNSVAPYVQAGRLRTYASADEILPGVRPVQTHGHTPGHTSYLFSSQGSQLLIWGDIVHNAAVQFPKPQVTIEFDSVPAQALATRLKVLGWTAKDALPVAGAHLPFPGIGQVRAEGKGRYSWVPVDYASTQP